VLEAIAWYVLCADGVALARLCVSCEELLMLDMAELKVDEVEEDTMLLAETLPASTSLLIVLVEVLDVAMFELDTGVPETTAMLLELDAGIGDELLELGTTGVEPLEAEPRAGGSHIEVELVVLSIELVELTLEVPISLAAEALLVLDTILATSEEAGTSDDDDGDKALLLLAEVCAVERAGGSHIEVEVEKDEL